MKIYKEISNVPKPVGPYSIATETNGVIFLSGQIALCPESGKMLGSDASEQAKQIMLNIGNVLSYLGLNFENIVKSTIFLTDLKNFSQVNEVYSSYLNNHLPARSTIGVAALPLNALVEIEVIVSR
jgi:2-iminobutanoate/2-iminopropanoate deaminase